MISVFTPTHTPDYLVEAYNSLCAQTYQDFEWVLVPNGPDARIPEPIAQDKRVRIVALEDTRIGALKAHAVSQCRGGLLVELDHDDVLVETCLADLYEAAAAADGHAFIHSDCVNFLPDGTSVVFHQSFGWEVYDCRSG